jgi:hypothetical protein
MDKKCCRAVVALVTLAWLCGCVPVHVTGKAPDDVMAFTGLGAGLHPGSSTRAEVYDLFGAPWLSSPYWRADVHRVDGVNRTITVWTGLAVILPEPVDTAWSGLVLITYGDDGLVTARDSGEEPTSRHGLMTSGPGLMLRASDMTFASNLLDPYAVGFVLLAGGPRMHDFLRIPPVAEDCKLVVACERESICPGKVQIGESNLVDPRAVKVKCTGNAPCPHGMRARPGSHSVHVPVLHARNVPAGVQRVVIGQLATITQSESTVYCPPGEVRFASVRSEPAGRRDFYFTLQVDESMPEEWAEYSLVVWRSNSRIHHLDALTD